MNPNRRAPIAVLVLALALAGCSSKAAGGSAKAKSAATSTSTTVTYSALEKTCISYRLVLGITAEAPQLGREPSSDQKEAVELFQSALLYLDRGASESSPLTAALSRLNDLFLASSATTQGGDTHELTDLATVAGAVGGQCDPSPPSTAAQVSVAWGVISAAQEDPTCFDVSDVVVSTADPQYAKATRLPDRSGEQKSCTLGRTGVLLDVSSSQQWQVVATSAAPPCGDAPAAVLAELYGAGACRT